MGRHPQHVASRLAHSALAALALAVPFVLIWIMPVVYWGTGRSREGFIDQLVHRASYLSMAWVSFILVFTIMLDLAHVSRVAGQTDLRDPRRARGREFARR